MKIKRIAIAFLGAVLFGMAVLGLTVFNCVRTVEVPLSSVSQDQTRGTLVRAEQVGDFPAMVLRALVWWGGSLEDVSIRNGLRIYRLQYWTVRYDGAATLASGLVATPKGAPPRGVISYQHGTTSNRHETPSAPTLHEGVLASALFAGGGYLLTAPDYIGLGTSREVHPYMITESTVNAVTDLLKAAHAFAGHLEMVWPTSLYLTGFSQGGHATMVAQRALEAMSDPRFQVVGSAPIAAPLDLAGISFPVALEGGSSAHSLYLAYMVYSYSTVYGHPVDSVMAEPYAGLVPVLFDGEHEVDAIVSALPAMPRSMFTKAFLDDFDHGRPTWLLTAIAENEAFQWAPKAPIRLYFGERDMDVSPKEAHAGAAELTKRGGDVTLVSVGEYGHDESVLHAALQVRRWFDELVDTVDARDSSRMKR